jgi:hypothetical protein
LAAQNKQLLFDKGFIIGTGSSKYGMNNPMSHWLLPGFDQPQENLRE